MRRRFEAARLEAASRGATTSGGGEPAAQPEKFCGDDGPAHTATAEAGANVQGDATETSTPSEPPNLVPAGPPASECGAGPAHEAWRHEREQTAVFEALSAPDHTAGDAGAAPGAVSNPAVQALKRVNATYFVDNYVPVPCGRNNRGTRTAWRNEPSRARGREGGRLLKSLRISLRADERVCQLLRARGTPEAEYDEAIDSWLLRHARHAAERDQWPNR